MNRITRTCITLAVGILLGSILTLTGSAQAEASEPYGGCDEAYLYPGTEGYRWCQERDRIRCDEFKRWAESCDRPRRLGGSWPLFTPDAEFRLCRNDDGSMPRRVKACVWDARHQGNGRGQSFIAIRQGQHREKAYLRLPHWLVKLVTPDHH